ncbi:MAG TPA: hypothetical protein VF715_00595 [Thermoleophilaceae bacterium]|jgi:hypothetical protein
MDNTHTTHMPVVFRPAGESDRPALSRLARLDDRRIPRGDLVLAQVGSEIRAAVSTSDGAAIADPWTPTAAIVDALRAWTRVAA